MKQTLAEILQGWGNQLRDEFDVLPKEIKNLSEKRLSICNTCSLRTDNTCSVKKRGKAVKTFVYKGQMRTKGTEYTGCGCNLAAKTKSVISSCPLGKW